jgi:hypothetical protein
MKQGEKNKEVTFLHKIAGYKLRNHQRNIDRQKLNIFYLNNEHKYTEKLDYARKHKGQ